MFMTMRSVVVFPAPLGPSRPKTLPRGIVRERSLTATWPAKALVTPDSWMALSLNCVIIGPSMSNTSRSKEAGEGIGGSGGARGSPQLDSERRFIPRERDEARGLFYVVVSTVAYGSLPILAKLAFATGVRTAGLLAWRFAVACMLFSLLARRAPPLALGTRLTLWGLGVIFVGNTVCYFGALHTIPASTASLIFYTYPVIVTLLSAALGLDRLTLRGVGAAVMAVSGCAITAGTVMGGSPRGAVLAPAAAFIYAAYVMLGSRFAAGIPSETVSLHVTQACAAIFLPLALLT